jgi:hypothetical protein
MKNYLSVLSQKIQAAITALFLLVMAPIRKAQTAFAQNQQYRLLNIVTFRMNGGILVAAVIGLGVLVIVLPLVYGIAATVGSSLTFPGIAATQSSTLLTLVANGGAALQLTSVSETVVGAGIIILGIALYFRLK